MPRRLLLELVILFVLSPAFAQAQPRGVIIEMEDYAERAPDDGSFADVTNESAASMRRVLVKFYVDGWVTYRFTADAAGRYSG